MSAAAATMDPAVPQPAEVLDEVGSQAVVPVTKFVAELEQIHAECNMVLPPGLATQLEDAFARNLARRKPAIVEASLVRRLRAPVVDLEPGIQALRQYIKDFKIDFDRKKAQTTVRERLCKLLCLPDPPRKSLKSREIELEMLEFQLNSMETAAVSNAKSAAIGHKFADQRILNGPATLEAVAAQVNTMTAQLAPVAGLAGVAEQPAEDGPSNARIVNKLYNVMGNASAAGEHLTVVVDHVQTQAAEGRN